MQKVKYLNQSELRKFFSVIAQDREMALFAAIYHYALRATEATMLNLNSIDFERKTIFIIRLKKGRGGEFPLLDNTATLIRRYLPQRFPTDPQALFTSRQGRISTRQIQRLFRQYIRAAGLDNRFTVHSLRHSMGTHLLNAGFDLSYIQNHLGHKHIHSTRIYAQVTDKVRANAFNRISQSDEILKF